MANLTITVDEEALKRARARALEEDISVNAVSRGRLEEYAGVRREAGRKILELSHNSATSSGVEGLPKREELYEERLGRYGRR